MLFKSNIYMMIPWLNVFGLLFDISGVIVLFNFGLSNVVTLDGTVFLLARPNSKEEEALNKKEGSLHFRMSRLGLSLILLGFFLQLAANCLSLSGGTNLPPVDKLPTYAREAMPPPSTVQAPKP